jgi:hypothetical protein
VTDNLGADLISFSFRLDSDQSLIGFGGRQRAQEVAEIVSECMKLQTHCVGGERSARQPRPLDRTLAFLDPLLGRAALVVEGDDPFGRRLMLVTMKPTRG